MFKITNDEALELLVNRVKFWKENEITIKLYSKMYENYIEEGVFDNNDLTIMEIVDNDIVNNCQTIFHTSSDFNNLKNLYMTGSRDVSCENLDCGASFIEAADDEENPTAFLIRY